MSAETAYFVWRSDEPKVSTERSASAANAAHAYALEHRVPYGIAIRVVRVTDVEVFGTRVEPSGT